MYSDASNTSLYDILEVDPNCSRESLRKAYRALSKRYDPQKSGRAEDAARYDQILHAYITLSDKFGRREYDRSIGVDHRRVRGGGGTTADGHETTILNHSQLADVTDAEAAEAASKHYYCPTCHGAGELFSYEKLPGGLMRELRTFCIFCGGGGSWPVPPPALTMEEDGTSSIAGSSFRGSRFTQGSSAEKESQ